MRVIISPSQRFGSYFIHGQADILDIIRLLPIKELFQGKNSRKTRLYLRTTGISRGERESEEKLDETCVCSAIFILVVCWKELVVVYFKHERLSILLQYSIASSFTHTHTLKDHLYGFTSHIHLRMRKIRNVQALVKHWWLNLSILRSLQDEFEG